GGHRGLAQLGDLRGRGPVPGGPGLLGQLPSPGGEPLRRQAVELLGGSLHRLDRIGPIWSLTGRCLRHAAILAVGRRPCRAAPPHSAPSPSRHSSAAGSVPTTNRSRSWRTPVNGLTAI